MRAQGPVAQWLEPTAHNGLVAGSSRAGPTTSPQLGKAIGRLQLTFGRSILPLSRVAGSRP